VIKHLKELFGYNEVANNKFIASFNEIEMINEKAISLFSHIFNAHELWQARIENREPQYGVWQVHENNDLLKINNDIHQNTNTLLSGKNETEIEKEIDYRNTEGVHYISSIKDILFHVINHSTYHRAQVAGLMRQENFEPPVTDYIAYKRK